MMNTNSNKFPSKLLVAITGASGMLFLHPFLHLLEHKKESLIVHGICSDSGVEVLKHEAVINKQDLPGITKWFDIDDFAAAPSSGSSGYDAMVILPCTMGSLAAIACGMSSNLIHRAADVMLKERKKLVLAVRETPFNRTHLQNMLKVHDAGAIIFPTMPGYYLKPKTLEEAALTFAWRLADHIGVEVKDRKRWEGDK